MKKGKVRHVVSVLSSGPVSKQEDVTWYFQFNQGKIYFLTNCNSPPTMGVLLAWKFRL